MRLVCCPQGMSRAPGWGIWPQIEAKRAFPSPGRDAVTGAAAQGHAPGAGSGAGVGSPCPLQRGGSPCSLTGDMHTGTPARSQHCALAALHACSSITRSWRGAPAALCAYRIARSQHCNPATPHAHGLAHSQPHACTGLHASSLAHSQHCMLTALHACSTAWLQPCTLAASHAPSFACSGPRTLTASQSQHCTCAASHTGSFARLQPHSLPHWQHRTRAAPSRAAAGSPVPAPCLPSRATGWAISPLSKEISF